MSALEFADWRAWLDAEQIGPEWDRLRHAELVAAAANGGNVTRKDGRPFGAADFLPKDPWEPDQAEMTQQQLRQRISAELDSMEDLFG